MTLRWHWGLGIGVVYAAFASATIGFVAFAMQTPVDLVSADYYAQSLEHDARQAAGARAVRLGDAFAIETQPERGRVVIRWPREMAAPTGWIRLYRPSDASADRVAAIAPGADGRQEVALLGLAPGRWVIKVQWQAGTETFYAERAVVTP